MNTDLLKLSLRYNSVYQPSQLNPNIHIQHPTLQLSKTLSDYGYSLSEDALHVLNAYSTEQITSFINTINEVLSLSCNWKPLVKGWDIPTNETKTDHLITLIVNIFGDDYELNGTTLPCGHIIPKDTFNLSRYNGCPFCGTPFSVADYVNLGQGDKKTILKVMTDGDMKKLLLDLLKSPVPLDATQNDTLILLLKNFPLPEDIAITIKETRIQLINSLIETNQTQKTSDFITSPSDILRLLWYRKIGELQVIRPKTLKKTAYKNYSHITICLDKSASAEANMTQKLKLHYDRKWCRLVAEWLNGLKQPAQKICEDMHPDRGMWVRFIRALRLTEYAKKEGFENLKNVLDCFYNSKYNVWKGIADDADRRGDVAELLRLMKQHPGAFARNLFSLILHHGRETVIREFKEVFQQLPPRLIMTLGMYADTYFNSPSRVVTTKTRLKITIPSNSLIDNVKKEEIDSIVKDINRLYIDYMKTYFERQECTAKTIYIAPDLFLIPISIGDRTATIQDTSCALQGMLFPVAGNKVRLFMQWGEGLHAQHLDMDLSCGIIYPDDVDFCSYLNLSPQGAKHSGDIQKIPEMTGTAEYIELDLPLLERKGARYVVFTCNAYSSGSISPNLKLGWMNAENEMKINDDGVAYDPSCVQHIVRISAENLSKGLVFGILNVAKREITWVEMPFDGQTIMSLNNDGVETYMKKLQAKIKIGDVLRMKAVVQHLVEVKSAAEADEAYTLEWAMNTAAVSNLLLLKI